MFDQRVSEAEHLMADAVSRLRHALKGADIHDRRLHREINRLERQGKRTCRIMRGR